MSRMITDEELLTWEIYPSAGRFGLPDQPKIIFNCISAPDRRARYVRHQGDNASAERFLKERGDRELRSLLASSAELD